jgi:hypothetical protein
MASGTALARTEQSKKRLSGKLLIIALLGFIITIPGYIFFTHTYASNYAFLASNGKLLKVTTARGETVTLGLQVEHGIDRHWASNQGLTLTLDGVSTPLQVVEPKEKDWDDTINTNRSLENMTFIVKGQLTIPSSIGGPEQRTLSGMLNGSIDYPAGGHFFENRTVDIYIPVQIQLEPQAKILRSDGRIFFDLFVGLGLLCGTVLVLLAVRRLRRTLFRMRENPASRSGWQIFKDWFYGLGTGAISTVICGVVLGGLLMNASTGGLSISPNDAVGSAFLISGLVGLSAGVSVLTFMVQDDKKQTGTRQK